jgi:hypothetical protein
VLGFANLTRLDVGAAAKAFDRAIALNQSEPLARLGLGLARIRQGDLAGGRQDIEIAVCLDPGSSLIRSYMGKAYFEERRDKLAGAQFRQAKVLDPQDPTPWLYDAILKQSENRTVDAYGDLQKSIELNDKRAVYRSKLLLDQDLATRTADLASIDQELGFKQLALIDGANAVNADIADFSAHRFLADAYAILPDREIARASEALQAALRQPPTLTPQPQPLLTQDSFSLAGAPGLNAPGLNEYSRLFDREGWSVYADAIAGDVTADRLLATTLKGKFAFGVEQQYEYTSGFRDNGDLRRRLYGASLTAQPGPSTIVYARVQQLDKENGDLAIRFDPQDVFQDRETTDNTSFLLGGSHTLAPGRQILAAYGDERLTSKIDVAGNVSAYDQRTHSLDLQYLHQGPGLAVLTGLASVRGDRNQRYDYPAYPQYNSSSSWNLSHDQGYVYGLMDLVPSRVSVQVGASIDRVRDAGVSLQRLSPKLGITVRLNPETTVRAAAARGVKRTLTANQTLEPTQLAGFNQFFDDFSGARWTLFALGLDRRVGSKSACGGALMTRRASRPVVLILDPVTTMDASRRERDLQAYCYWAVSDSATLAVDYYYQKLVRPDDEPDFTAVTTQRLPIALNLFVGHQWQYSLVATAVYQSGTFLDAALQPYDGKSRFVVVDAAAKWRLPGRRGVFSLEALNLFDRRFRYQETDPVRPQLALKRQLMARIKIAF